MERREGVVSVTDAAIIQRVRKALPYIPKNMQGLTEHQALKCLEAFGYHPPPKAGHTVSKKAFDKTKKQLRKKRTREKAFGDALLLVVNRLRPKKPVNDGGRARWCELLEEQMVDNESLMALWLIYVTSSPLERAEDLSELWEGCVIIWGKYTMLASPRMGKALFVWGIFWMTIDGREPVPYQSEG
jgi:hypothetical protein